MTPPDTRLKEETKTIPPEVQPKPLRQRFKLLKVPGVKPDHLLLGGAVLAAVGLALAQPNAELPKQALDPNQFCQEMVQPKAVLSREQLAQLLTVPERGDRTKVQSIVKQPYCRMPNLSVRAGATTERHAYPLASDPQTWVVILYEGKTYVGYGFKRA
ncbi:MAG TPA: hypothetical protein V6D14_10770 [Coleofasciculaceae cyanobacterium]|jgi:hypothetical protein